MEYSLPTDYVLDNRYKIVKVLGQGGFGIIYLAKDMKEHDNFVCIKELFISGSSTRNTDFSISTQSQAGFTFRDFKQMFMGEALKLARFKHPNIVDVRALLELNDTIYMVMGYVEGCSLKTYIQNHGALSGQAAKHIMLQILEAVESVHSESILHRDIKPDNILITPENNIVLIDFGSARDSVQNSDHTQTAMVSPGYAPLEQYSYRAKRGTYTDIYALGATFYYLLTGLKPIPATDRSFDYLKPPFEVVNTISKELSEVIMAAMELIPANRIQYVSELRTRLEDCYIEKEDDNLNITFILIAITLVVGSVGFLFVRSGGSDTKSEQNVESSIYTPVDSLELSHVKDLQEPVRSLVQNMVLIPGGRFMMGCTPDQGNDCFDIEEPAHNKSIQTFYLGKYPVTQEQWYTIMRTNNNRNITCVDCPITEVSWLDVQLFLEYLNELTGDSFRLPSESEWEYAARGGNRTQMYKYSGSNKLNEVGWFEDNSNLQLQPVGRKYSNELGLYDMSGNVWEWCSNTFYYYSESYSHHQYQATASQRKALRGGAYDFKAEGCRVSVRDAQATDYKQSNVGFRIAR